MEVNCMLPNSNLTIFNHLLIRLLGVSMVGMADNAAEFNMNKVKTFYANMYGASLTGYEKDSIVKTVLHMLYLKKSICKFKVHTFKVF